MNWPKIIELTVAGYPEVLQFVREDPMERLPGHGAAVYETDDGRQVHVVQDKDGIRKQSQ
jgi:hypothetical protein